MQLEHETADRVESSLKDICLIAAFLEGKQSAFDELFHKYKDRLFSLCYRFLGNRTDAEDVVQDAFLDIYAGLHRFKGDAAFYTWAYSITIRLCYKHIKQRKTPSLLPDDLIYESESSEQDHVDRIAIRQGLAKLTDDRRMLLILRYYQQFSYEEIAGMLSCNAAQVRDRLRRARLRLNEVLSEDMRGGSK